MHPLSSQALRKKSTTNRTQGTRGNDVQNLTANTVTPTIADRSELLPFIICFFKKISVFYIFSFSHFLNIFYHFSNFFLFFHFSSPRALPVLP